MRKLLLFLFLIVSTLQAYSQSNYLHVIAKPGDGIYTLLRRHGLNPSEHLKHFLELNQDKIGDNNSLVVGKKYLLPPVTSAAAGSKTKPVTAKTASVETSNSSRVLKVPLFGDKYERIEVRSQALKGAVYYLSSGHGGPDPGAVGKYGPYELAEDEYAYDVTIRLARRLMEYGATVYMVVQDENDGIRDEGVLKMDYDEEHHGGKKISTSQKYRLRERTAAINQLYYKHKGAYQRMLSIHVDSRSIGKNIDVFFYHHENSASGEKLAKSIHQVFTSKYKRYQPNRDYFGSVSHRSSLYEVKYSYPPNVFIELGNIRNSLDQRRFVIADNRQALANWIADGIINDYKSK
ncbi:N-acetylmuramoyl-L-alanine amidase family protein [Pontibacter ruber]|uniref:N-acetylmuramoyl-L-alanine amidase n=1 Tax=Pontibacter ruber TaxID=1343895 RepID=A0ABW5CUQ6_9BACT|nr:N-acetylmuramoyl-L-alanine amidase [Pontibacter ruber]